MPNSQNLNVAKEKAHTAVSLPRAFAVEVAVMAGLCGRSVAKQLEHSFRIAQAVEQILPSATVHALKSGELPASELLMGLAAVLQAPGKSWALAQALQANPSRIHFDGNDPAKACLTRADGSIVEGRILEDGSFVAGPTAPSPQHGTPQHGRGEKTAKTTAPVSRKRGAARKPVAD